MAAKTGTTTAFRDAWAAGFTPEVTVVVWVGDPGGTAMHALTGLIAAGPLWRAAMLAAMEGRPHRVFERPAGVVRARVCATSGAIATARCPSSLPEAFRVGSAPTENCPQHGARRRRPGAARSQRPVSRK